MKNIYLGLLLCIMSLEAIVYENAEDGSVARWTISDNDPAGAKVNNLFDVNLNSKVIELKGAGYENEYAIGGDAGSENAWNETSKRYLTFSLNNSDGFLLDVTLETTNGVRYIRYRDEDANLGIEGEYISIGLGYDAADGKWHEFIRNLSDDLKLFEPNNNIVAVHGLQIRGNCKIDNIELGDKPLNEEFVIYEDAEDGKTNRWAISENPAGNAKVSNVFNNEINSKVIKLEGIDSYENKYELRFTESSADNLNLKWDMQTSEGFIIDVIVATSFGERTVRYRDDLESKKGIEGETIFYGLGYFSANGFWHNYSRDLQEDVQAFEPNNNVLSVKSFVIRAKCNLDNIGLFSTPSKIYEDAEDGKKSRWQHYKGPENASISNQYDNDLKSRVISLKGDSYANQYIIGGDMYDDNGWNDTRHTHIQWRMKNSSGYVVSLMVKTKNGNRYLEYHEAPFTLKARDGESLSYGLGYASSDGLWHTYIRDIVLDLKRLEPENELLSIEGMIIIGSVEIDDLELFKIHHPTEHSAGFALTFDDFAVDNWFSMRDKFLEYGIKPTFFISGFDQLEQSHIDKLKTLENDGAEIGCHTYSHAGVTRDYNNDINLIDQYLNEQIIPIVNDMRAAGFRPESFSYPFGEHEEHYDAALRNYFPYLRTTAEDKERRLYQIEDIYHKRGKNYNMLAGDGIDNAYGNELDEIQEAFMKASKSGEIITLYAHKIVNDLNDLYAITPQKLEKVMQYSRELGLESYTFKNAYLVSE